MIHEAFDRNRLSAREETILDAAIEGLTDVQIAQQMKISPSTVNSYWVRIRGKLGQLSRTEMVALALKQKSQNDLAAVHAQLETLRREAHDHVQMTSDSANAETYRAALDAMPEAVLLCCERGLIRYANARLESMFGFAERELIDESVTILLPVAQREDEARRLAQYMTEPHPLHLGLDRVVYGQRRGGSLIRIVLLVDSRPVSTGRIVTCVVRDFTSEIETRRRYATGWS